MTTNASIIDANATLNEIVERHPRAHPVLVAFGLDTCCGGGKRLQEACNAHGLDAARVLAALGAATAPEAMR